jgi:hypothetical protein
MVMSLTVARTLAELAMVVALGSAVAEEPPVHVNVEGLPAHLAERVKMYAAQGKTALIRLIHRTRMIYGLRLEELLRPARDTER